MPPVEQPQNKILAALPVEEYEGLRQHLTPVALTLGDILYSPDERISEVYFPNTAVISLVTNLKDGKSVEVGLVGQEGMVGISTVLGDDISTTHAIVQIADGGMRMKASILKEALKGDGQLLPLLLRATLARLKQVSQTAACNSSHNIEKRLARWLLMCHDRVPGDELKLTQEFIAQMLAIRRSGVSEAAIGLQRAGLIRYSRGHITIIDRTKLEDFACECYGIVMAAYNRLLES